MYWKFFFILFFSIYCFKEDEIIKLPLNSKGEYHSSKYGFIYQLDFSFNNDIGWLPPTYYYIYKFKNMKNLHLLDIKKLTSNKMPFHYEIYEYEKDEIHLLF